MNRFFNFSKAIVILTVLFTAITAYANDKTTAVLQHGDTPQAFYGADAFKEAMEAAQHGDRISLSSGVFNQTTINKAVKIQGAGIYTQINGELHIAVEDAQPGLVIEGIKFLNWVRIKSKLVNATLKRCTFDYFANESDAENNLYVQCIFHGGQIEVNNYWEKKQIVAVVYSNCIFRGLDNIFPTDDVSLQNCVFVFNANIGHINTGSFNNCIFFSGVPTASAVKFTNIIAPSDSNDKPNKEAVQENIILLPQAEIKALFKDFENYELTDEAAAKYLGSDGKQLGAYGGAFPFTLTPAIPEITSVKIDPLVKEDGKLSISISAKTNN